MGEQTPDDTDRQDGHDAAQAPQRRHVIRLRLPRDVNQAQGPVETTHERLARDEHLQADARQDERQPLVELGKGVLDGVEQEVERLETQQRHDVACDDDERVARHRQDRWDRVHGEHDVNATEHDDRHTEGRQLEATLLPGRVGRAVAVLGDRQDPGEEAVHLVLFEIEVVVVITRLELDSRVDQERSQKNGDEGEPLDGGDTDRDERNAQHDRHHDAPDQQGVVVATEQHERRDHQRPHEDVVERQRVLHEVASEVLLPGGAAVQEPGHCAERDAHAEPQQRLQRSPLEGRGFVLAVEHEHVEPNAQGEYPGQREPLPEPHRQYGVGTTRPLAKDHVCFPDLPCGNLTFN